MDKKYWLSVGVLILLMVVSACGKGGNTTGAPTSQFIGGFEGVSMAFEKDSPPPEVTDDGTFEFRAILKLRNEGGNSFIFSYFQHVSLENLSPIPASTQQIYITPKVSFIHDP